MNQQPSTADGRLPSARRQFSATLWVRVPPEPLAVFLKLLPPCARLPPERAQLLVLVEQPGVLACLSRRRSRVQIPSRTFAARYANWLSGEIQTFVSAGSTPACATDRVVLLVAACKAVVTKQARWATRGSIPSQPIQGQFVYRLRTPASQAGRAGSIPARVTHGQVV